MSESIDRVIAFHRAAGHYPGIVLRVERAGRVLLARSAGYMEGSSGDAAMPMREDAMFRIASLTKGIVSVVAMMFVEQGDVLLDAPASDYLPVLAGLRLADGRAPRRPPTVRDLMRHTSGLAYLAETRDANARAAAVQVDLDARLATIDSGKFLELLAALPLCAEPGTAFRYGFSTDVLGLILERVAGRRLGEILGERLFGPLGMRETGFAPTAAAPERLARGFDSDMALAAFVARHEAALRAGLPMQSGGGGLISTVPDFARFARFLADGAMIGDARLLRPESFAELTRDQLGDAIDGPFAFTGPGFGFSLAYAVRRPWGASAYPTTTGEFTWSGVSGTFVYVQPAERWFAVGFTCNTASRLMTRFELRRAIATC